MTGEDGWMDSMHLNPRLCPVADVPGPASWAGAGAWTKFDTFHIFAQNQRHGRNNHGSAQLTNWRELLEPGQAQPLRKEDGQDGGHLP